MNYLFSKHALTQIEKRNIHIDWIHDAIKNPEKISIEDNITVISKFIEIETKLFLLRIFINESVLPHIVITAYLTSKIEKYYESNL
ncbi:MAG: DUF4258 domain-containing protein [Bacteroidetes bacterium]|nr:DUF4258 domain-containing protein [Bacteroidota bacterium]MBL0287882.1 DUF4258 domain-containing protein [Bacteroidota bacterium]